MQEVEKAGQVSLFQFAGLEAGETSSIFARGDIVDKKTGLVIGNTWKLGKDRDARKALKLSGKDDRDEYLHRKSDAKVAAFKRVKAMINAMDDSAVGLERLQLKEDRNGLAEFTMRAKQIPQSLMRKALTLEKIAAAFGCTLEEAKAKLAAAEKKTVNVESTVTTDSTVVETEGTGMSDEELEKLTAPQPTDAQPASVPVEASE